MADRPNSPQLQPMLLPEVRQALWHHIHVAENEIPASLTGQARINFINDVRAHFIRSLVENARPQMVRTIVAMARMGDYDAHITLYRSVDHLQAGRAWGPNDTALGMQFATSTYHALDMLNPDGTFRVPPPGSPPGSLPPITPNFGTTLEHEIAHRIDLGPNGLQFSAQPEFINRWRVDRLHANMMQSLHSSMIQGNGRFTMVLPGISLAQLETHYQTQLQRLPEELRATMPASFDGYLRALTTPDHHLYNSEVARLMTAHGGTNASYANRYLSMLSHVYAQSPGTQPFLTQFGLDAHAAVSRAEMPHYPDNTTDQTRAVEFFGQSRDIPVAMSHERAAALLSHSEQFHRVNTTEALARWNVEHAQDHGVQRTIMLETQMRALRNLHNNNPQNSPLAIHDLPAGGGQRLQIVMVSEEQARHFAAQLEGRMLRHQPTSSLQEIPEVFQSPTHRGAWVVEISMAQARAIDLPTENVIHANQRQVQSQHRFNLLEHTPPPPGRVVPRGIINNMMGSPLVHNFRTHPPYEAAVTAIYQETLAHLHQQSVRNLFFTDLSAYQACGRRLAGITDENVRMSDPEYQRYVMTTKLFEEAQRVSLDPVQHLTQQFMRDLNAQVLTFSHDPWEVLQHPNGTRSNISQLTNRIYNDIRSSLSLHEQAQKWIQSGVTPERLVGLTGPGCNVTDTHPRGNRLFAESAYQHPDAAPGSPEYHLLTEAAAAELRRANNTIHNASTIHLVNKQPVTAAAFIDSLETANRWFEKTQETQFHRTVMQTIHTEVENRLGGGIGGDPFGGQYQTGHFDPSTSIELDPPADPFGHPQGATARLEYFAALERCGAITRTNGQIRYEPIVGTDLRIAARNAAFLASTEGKNVTLHFNGQDILVTPGQAGQSLQTRIDAIIPQYNGPAPSGTAPTVQLPATTAELAGLQPGRTALAYHAYVALNIQVTPATPRQLRALGITDTGPAAEQAFRATQLLNELGMNHHEHYRTALEGNGRIEIALNTPEGQARARRILEAHKTLADNGHTNLPEVRVEGTGANQKLVVTMSQQGANQAEIMGNRAQQIGMLFESAPNYLHPEHGHIDAHAAGALAIANSSHVSHTTLTNYFNLTQELIAGNGPELAKEVERLRARPALPENHAQWTPQQQQEHLMRQFAEHALEAQQARKNGGNATEHLNALQTIRNNAAEAHRTSVARQIEEHHRHLAESRRQSRGSAAMNLIGVYHGINSLWETSHQWQQLDGLEKAYRLATGAAQIGLGSAGATTDLITARNPNLMNRFGSNGQVGLSRLGNFGHATGTGLMAFGTVTSSVDLYRGITGGNQDGYQWARITAAGGNVVYNGLGTVGSAMSWRAATLGVESAAGRGIMTVVGYGAVPIAVAQGAAILMHGYADHSYAQSAIYNNLNSQGSRSAGRAGIAEFGYVDIPGLPPRAGDYNTLGRWNFLSQRPENQMTYDNGTVVNWGQTLQTNPREYARLVPISGRWNRQRAEEIRRDNFAGIVSRDAVASTWLGRAVNAVTGVADDLPALRSEMMTRSQLNMMSFNVTAELSGDVGPGRRNYMDRHNDYVRIIRPLERDFAPQIAELERLRIAHCGMLHGNNVGFAMNQLGLSEAPQSLQRQYAVAMQRAGAAHMARRQRAGTLAQQYSAATTDHEKIVVMTQIRDLLGISQADWTRPNPRDNNKTLEQIVREQADHGRTHLEAFLTNQVIANSEYRPVAREFAGRLNFARERQRVEAMSPAEQTAYFARNAEFVRRYNQNAGLNQNNGLEHRPDFALMGLSRSREEYTARAMQFAPETMEAQARRESAQYATQLAALTQQNARLAAAMPALDAAARQLMGGGAAIGDKPWLDSRGQPVRARNPQGQPVGPPLTLADSIRQQKEALDGPTGHPEQGLVGQRNALRAKLTGPNRETDAAVIADINARITLIETGIAARRLQLAATEQQNMVWRMQRLEQMQREYGQATQRLFDDAIAVTGGGAAPNDARLTELTSAARRATNRLNSRRAAGSGATLADIVSAQTEALMASRALAERLTTVVRSAHHVQTVGLHRFNSDTDVAFGFDETGRVQTGLPASAQTRGRVRGTIGEDGTFRITHIGHMGGSWREFTPPAGFINAFRVSTGSNHNSIAIPEATLRTLAQMSAPPDLFAGARIESSILTRNELREFINNRPNTPQAMRNMVNAWTSDDPDGRYVLVNMPNGQLAIARGTAENGSTQFQATSLTMTNTGSQQLYPPRNFSVGAVGTVISALTTASISGRTQPSSVGTGTPVVGNTVNVTTNDAPTTPLNGLMQLALDLFQQGYQGRPQTSDSGTPVALSTPSQPDMGTRTV